MQPSKRRRKCVTLMLTERCNLSCTYCYERRKLSSRMSPAIARAAIERHLCQPDNTDEIEFQFHGGEPLLEFETMRDVAEWTWSQKWSKPFIFFASTNGTLLHGDLQTWFTRHKDRIWLGLSLDGTPGMQNLNRSNSFDQIDIPFFLRTWPEQSLKVTVSEATLSTLAEGVKYLHRIGFKFHCSLAHGVNWLESVTQNTYAAQLAILVEFYLANPSIAPCNLLNIPLELTSDRPIERRKWCGVGTDMVTIDLDGKEYPCHFFLRSVMDPSAAARTAPLFNDPDSLCDATCCNCRLLPLCPTCYGMNVLGRGHPARRDPMFCHLFKIQALAASKLQSEMLLRPHEFGSHRKMAPKRAIRLIDAIQHIQAAFAGPIDE